MRSYQRRGSALFTKKVTFPKAGITVTNTLFIITLSCSILLNASQLWATPTSATQAEKVVRGWLRVDAKPMGTRLGDHVQRVDTFVDETAQPLYYVVYLEPRGFVILPADDQIEPIIAFARQGEYDPSLNNPLGALVNNDLGGRVRTAQQLTAKRKSGVPIKALGRREAALQLGADKAQSRWRNLRHFGEASDTLYADDDPPITNGFTDISDIRVAPLLFSEWDQGNVDGAPCYNYYTPNNYPCGCVATAMAQLMRYHEYPILGIGRNNFLITVDGQTQAAKTRGGDGRGGPYVWSEMTLVPETGVTEEQRQAIGALCFDAGITAHMSYTAGSSGAWMDDALEALLETFGYANGIHGFNDWENVGEGLIEMTNPNLDGKYPVLFGITNNTSGHAIVCDGYGYHGISMYHHLNMGWGGYKDLWYHLPTVLDFEIVRSCTYNVFPSGSGEIISGRVIDMAEEPIAGVEITGEVVGCDPCDPCTVCIFTATTDYNGIYALLKVPSDANFVITAEKEDFYFDSQEATTGLSEDMQPVAGNVWGIDFVAQSPPPDHDECEQAIPLQLNIPSYFASFGATGDSHSSCSDGTDNKDVWHTFTPPPSGYFQFSLCDSTFDTTLAVYDDCNELSRVELGCNDDSELCGPQSELVLL
ncbi:MAG: C10 family peptidase, partial [Sedimentisphaerales bacterium]|nr:C10 family peptidase [Sedimentisphaerales bacterium]